MPQQYSKNKNQTKVRSYLLAKDSVLVLFNYVDVLLLLLCTNFIYRN